MSNGDLDCFEVISTVQALHGIQERILQLARENSGTTNNAPITDVDTNLDDDVAWNRTIYVSSAFTAYVRAAEAHEPRVTQPLREEMCLNCATNGCAGPFYWLRRCSGFEHSRPMIPDWLFALCHGYDGFIRSLKDQQMLSVDRTSLGHSVDYMGLQLKAHTTAFEVAVMLNKELSIIKLLPVTSRGVQSVIFWLKTNKRFDIMERLLDVPDVTYIVMKTRISEPEQSRKKLKLSLKYYLKAYSEKHGIDELLRKSIELDCWVGVKYALKKGADANKSFQFQGRKTKPLRYAILLYRPRIIGRLLAKGGKAGVTVVPIDVRCFKCTFMDTISEPHFSERAYHGCEDIFDLARHGYGLRLADTCPCLLRIPDGTFSWNLTQIFILMSLGAHVHFPPHFRATFERDVTRYGGQWASEFLHRSGYKFSTLEYLHWRSEITHDETAQETLRYIEDITSTPLSLYQLSANQIRACLQPNALHGLKKLDLPPHLDIGAVRLDLSRQNFYDFALKAPTSRTVVPDNVIATLPPVTMQSSLIDWPERRLREMINDQQDLLARRSVPIVVEDDRQ